MTIKELEENNALFANALALAISGKEKFEEILYSAGQSDIEVKEYVRVVEKFTNDFKTKLEKNLQGG